MLLEDFPGLGKTLAARSFAQTLGLEFRRAQFTPDLLPATSPARSSTTSAPATSPSARARCSPVCCSPTRSTGRPEDAVGPAGGDAGAADHRRGRDVRAARAVPRARDGQPGRVRRHLPAARGAARPVPACGSASATRTPTRRTRCCTAGWRGNERSRPSTRSATPPASLAMQARRDGHGRRTISRYCVDLARPRGRSRRSWSERRRAAHSACCSRPAASRSSRGRDFVVPEDVKAVAAPRPRPPAHPEARASG